LSAAFSAGIALSAVIMMFGLSVPGVELSWWGNDVVSEGCEGGGCTLMTLAEGERFYPWWNSWVAAP